ncbi:MAG: hypothetical protein ACR2PR_06345 [Pseudohongiellaceae bacterium]
MANKRNEFTPKEHLFHFLELIAWGSLISGWLLDLIPIAMFFLGVIVMIGIAAFWAVG